MFCESNMMQFYIIFKIKAPYRMMRLISKPLPLNAPVDCWDYSKHPCAMSGKSTRVPNPTDRAGTRSATGHNSHTSDKSRPLSQQQQRGDTYRRPDSTVARKPLSLQRKPSPTWIVNTFYIRLARRHAELQRILMGNNAELKKNKGKRTDLQTAPE